MPSDTMRGMNIAGQILVGCSLFLFASCTKQAEAPAPAPAPSAPAAAPSAETIAKLAKADAVDGKTDKVVSKCAGCALGMDGKAAHAANLGEYTVHFCDHCADKTKDVEKIGMALKLPN